MPHYQVATIDRPENWTPECLDDVPLELRGPVEVLCESDDLFAAVDRAMEYNESDEAARRGRWAAVVEPGVAGRFWPAARLCTPIAYRAVPIDWPEGWEPNTPLDVPNCVWQAREQPGGESLDYAQAEATVLALNRQCMIHPGAAWHVVVATENEPTSRTVSYDPAGTETTTEFRNSHVVRPEGGGHGDCSHCPAAVVSCDNPDCSAQPQTIAARHSRAFGAASEAANT
ncbi:MAG: hypothetical protein LLG00_02925 [Planctomycetaceae bacterium]|nr:hypothetical protein [Planctomycetaceae bacterium]